MQNDQAHADTAEVVEGRELAKGNSGQQTRVRTQCRVALSRALDRVRQAAKDSAKRLTALWHHVHSTDRLREASYSLNHDAAPGVDGQTWAAYGEQLESNLRDLADRLKRGAYQAPPVERVYIPKADGRQRPIGKPTLEDKIIQRATVEVLNAIYEEEFVGFSYGARPGRNPHHALDAVTVGLEKRSINWVLDADIRGFYDAIDHAWLVKFIEHRIGDQRVVRHMRKWLKAGVLEDGQWRQQEAGTPQGGSVSPPTKLQTFFFGIVITRIWVDPKYDIDLVTRDFHSLDERPDKVAFARPVRRLQPVVEFGGQVLQAANNQLQLPAHGGRLRQRLALFLQPGQALAQAGNPGLKLGLVNEALRITVDQPGHALASLADLVLDGGPRRAFGVRLGLQ